MISTNDRSALAAPLAGVGKPTSANNFLDRPCATKTNITKDESGQVLILAALCLSCLLGIVAFSVDVGLLLRSKRVLQTAADSAAIAGAAELNFGDVTTAAQADASQNGVTDGANGASVAVSQPSAGYVQVIVSQSQSTFFMRIFGRSSMTVSALAVAAAVPSPSCIVTLGTVAPGISVTNGGNLTLSTCGIVDDATGGGALTASGGAVISATSIGVVGSASITNGASVTPTPVTGITALSDPLSFETPPPASDYSSGCLADPRIHTNQTIGPSSPTGFVCYNGLSFPNGSPTVTLNPGLYIINWCEPTKRREWNDAERIGRYLLLCSMVRPSLFPTALR